MNTDELTGQAKEIARRHGAALVGVGPVDRFDPMPPLSDAAPEGHHPRDFLPDARSVISIAQPILNPVMDAPAKTDPKLCRRRREGKHDAPVRGDCVRICPIPKPRRGLPERLKRLMEEGADVE